MATYKAVVEEESVDCGHAHRTIEAAERCLANHQRWYCQHGGRVSGDPCRRCNGPSRAGSTSSTHWDNGTIHTTTGRGHRCRFTTGHF